MSIMPQRKMIQSILRTFSEVENMSFGIEFDREKFDLDEEKACEKIDEYLHMWNCFEEESNMVFFLRTNY